MTRRILTGRLQRATEASEDINPMDGVANLADVMLVFACGLMLALILNWNLDVGGMANQSVQVEQGQEITEIEGSLTDDNTSSLNQDTQYEELGMVYRDPDTGKLYMVVKDE